MEKIEHVIEECSFLFSGKEYILKRNREDGVRIEGDLKREV